MKAHDQTGITNKLKQRPYVAALYLAGLLTSAMPLSAQTCPLSYGSTDSAKSHWLFLYFPTTDDSTFPAYTTNASPAKAFDVSALTTGIGTTTQLIDTIAKVVKDDYCEFNVQVRTTTTNPATMATPPARRVTVAIGSDANGTAWGQAQEVDIGDAINIDFARVWAGTYVSCEGGTGAGCSSTGALTGANNTLEHWAQAIGGTAAHEAGHTYGLAHTDDDGASDPCGQPGPGPRAGEDALTRHLMPAGCNLSGTDRANFRRHISDRTFGILATNVGLSIQTMHNWDLVNPNANSASSLVIDFLSTLSSINISWSYGGSRSPWLNPTVSGPSGTAVFQGTTYNKYRITWSAPNSAWTNSAPGVVAGGAVFHIGATFTGVDFNVPDPIIIQNVTLRDSSSNPLTLHPRLPSYDAGTVDAATGDFSVRFFPPAGLQLQSARIFQLPRVAAIESMLGTGEPFALDQLPIRPWSVSDCKPVGSREGVACNVANISQKPHVEVIHRLGELGVIDCSKGGFGGNPGAVAGLRDRATPIDDEGPMCAGSVQDPFPSTTVYIIAKFVDPAAEHFDPVSKTFVVGPVVSTVYYQFAGMRQRPGGQGTVPPPPIPAFQGRLVAGALAGASWPIGSMRKNFNPGFHFQGFLEGRVTSVSTKPTLRLGLQLGFHEFDAKSAGIVSGSALSVTNLSFTARALGGSAGSYRPFLLAGYGVYHAAGVVKPGAQVGGGLDLPVPRGISLMPGVAFHSVNAPQGQIGRLSWWEAYLGFAFRVPK
jgi:hypothetical protein